MDLRDATIFFNLLHIAMSIDNYFSINDEMCVFVKLNVQFKIVVLDNTYTINCIRHNYGLYIYFYGYLL